jgi:hypothetical protein
MNADKNAASHYNDFRLTNDLVFHCDPELGRP